MIVTQKLVGLYVQLDQEWDIEGQRSIVAGFVVEVIKVYDGEKPEGGGVVEGGVLGVGGLEMNDVDAYCIP